MKSYFNYETYKNLDSITPKEINLLLNFAGKPIKKREPSNAELEAKTVTSTRTTEYQHEA